MRFAILMLLAVAPFAYAQAPAVAAAPKPAAAKPAATAPSGIPTPAQLKYPPLKQVTVPEPVEFTLSNGMRVYLLENHELPLVRGTALVRTGNLFDPAEMEKLGWIYRSVGR